jgi:hypothetical protein
MNAKEISNIPRVIFLCTKASIPRRMSIIIPRMEREKRTYIGRAFLPPGG